MSDLEQLDEEYLRNLKKLKEYDADTLAGLELTFEETVCVRCGAFHCHPPPLAPARPNPSLPSHRPRGWPLIPSHASSLHHRRTAEMNALFFFSFLW